MNWRLLFCDIAARFIGLVGLYATVLLARFWFTFANGAMVHTVAMSAVAAFSLVMTGLFLLPKTHDAFLLKTNQFWAFGVFVFVCFIWFCLIGLMLFSYMDYPKRLITDEVHRNIFFYGFPTALLLFSVTIFPFWTSYSGLPVVTASDAEGMRARKPGRKSDLWDNICAVFIFSPMFAGVFSAKLGTTTPTAELSDLVNGNFYLALALCFSFWLPAVANFTLRGFPENRQNKNMGRGTKFVVLGLAGPMLVGLTFFVATSGGASWFWNSVTTNPVGTVHYEVVDELSSRRKNCISFQPEGRTDLRFENCGLDRYWGSRLDAGDLVAVTGELSPFGHTFSDIQVLDPS